MPTQVKQHSVISLLVSRKTTGNWTGVTVGASKGYFDADKQQYQVTDLPGLSNLAELEQQSKDVAISKDFLRSEQMDCVVNIVDSTQLSRQLFLTSQIFELNLPVVVVLTKTDRKTAAKVNLDRLSQLLGCPVVSSSAKQPLSSDKLAAAIALAKPVKPFVDFELDDLTEQQVTDKLAITENRYSSGQDCECSAETLPVMQQRHKAVRVKVSQVLEQPAQVDGITTKLDNLLLHPVIGLPFFLFAMYLLFMFAINVGSSFIDFFDILSGGLFVDMPVQWLAGIGLPTWLLTIIEGVGMGIQTVATFIPVIVCLFIGLSILESSGYLARAAFVIDSLMQKIGLPGKAFVPLIVGFWLHSTSCNVDKSVRLRARATDNSNDVSVYVLWCSFARLCLICCGVFSKLWAKLSIFAVFDWHCRSHWHWLVIKSDGVAW